MDTESKKGSVLAERPASTHWLTQSTSTDTAATYNASVTYKLPKGFNPYVTFATSTYLELGQGSEHACCLISALSLEQIQDQERVVVAVDARASGLAGGESQRGCRLGPWFEQAEQKRGSLAGGDIVFAAHGGRHCPRGARRRRARAAADGEREPERARERACQQPMAAGPIGACARKTTLI